MSNGSGKEQNINQKLKNKTLANNRVVYLSWLIKWASSRQNLFSGVCEQQKKQTSLRIRAV